MTKKSKARQDRDAFVKEAVASDVNDWAILDTMKQGLGTFLATKMEVVKVHLGQQEVLNLMPPEEKQEFMVRSTALIEDCKIISKDMVAIGDKHKDRTGSTTDFNELRELIVCQEEYYLMQERIDGVITPNAAKIDAIMGVQVDAMTYTDQKAARAIGTDDTNTPA